MLGYTLTREKRNAYFIQLEDDSCTGNEDTRAFLLGQLTSQLVSEVYCLACGIMLPVYDHFPLIDGVLFISPVCHRASESHTRGRGVLVTWGASGNGCSGNGASNVLVPPPGCCGPRQAQTSSGCGNGGGGDRHVKQGRANGGQTRQERYLHAICMNCMGSTHPCRSGSLPTANIAFERAQEIAVGTGVLGLKHLACGDDDRLKKNNKPYQQQQWHTHLEVHEQDTVINNEEKRISNCSQNKLSPAIHRIQCRFCEKPWSGKQNREN
ncbi:unnamed protein product [Protopolystoma xenopodis]|uniref:Headcase middle domain-containing protein n=1 Tax=Protopolystoma xenopodis TaxID=117903 RepID=A0A448XB13_9PLAT|nr:unnamed protein product [Protopolystoma xenopodis]